MPNEVILLGPENLKAKHRVIELTSIKEADGNFQISYHIHNPFTGKHHYFDLTVPKEVTPIDPIWDEITRKFDELFVRKENSLVYRDILRTLVIEEIYKRTKKPPKREVVEKPTTLKEAPPKDERSQKFATLVDLTKKIAEMNAIVESESQPESERKKAEIRLKAFSAKAETIAKELGIDLSKPLPEKLPEEPAGDDLTKRYEALKVLAAKIQEMEKLVQDESQPESERKKAEIRLKAFRTKAETEAKELGVDISKPLPESLSSTGEIEIAESKDEKLKLIKSLMEKIKEMEGIAEDETQPESEREKAKIRARAFRTKAEKEAESAGIDINSL